MINCQSCGRENLDRSQFCEECGTRLVVSTTGDKSRVPSYVPPVASNPGVRISNITSVGIPPLVEKPVGESKNSFESSAPNAAARLIPISRCRPKNHTSVDGMRITEYSRMWISMLTIRMQKFHGVTRE